MQHQQEIARLISPWLDMLKPTLKSLRARLVSVTSVTLLVALAGIGTLAAQYAFFRKPDFQYGYLPSNRYETISLWHMNHRADLLAKISDPVLKDKGTISFAGDALQLDLTLGRDARVFVRGALGTNNSHGEMVYSILRNYLFPRDVDISLDGQAGQIYDGDYFIPCD